MGQQGGEGGEGAGGQDAGWGQGGGLDAGWVDLDVGQAKDAGGFDAGRPHLRRSDSTRWVSRPVVRASIRPGKPAPEPRSTKGPSIGGTSGVSWSESSTWRCQIVASSRSAVRLIRAFQRSSRAT